MFALKLKHYIIEGFCDEKADKNLACGGTFQMRSYCFSCPQFSFVQSENEIAISDDDGVVASLEDWIGFGGDMEPMQNETAWIAEWQKICRAKVAEAYQEYMQKLKASKDA